MKELLAVARSLGRKTDNKCVTVGAATVLRQDLDSSPCVRNWTGIPDPLSAKKLGLTRFSAPRLSA